MEPPRVAGVHRASLELVDEVDPAAVGAAVTVELCGSWDHAGPCRWPHNNVLVTGSSPVAFRTVFAAPVADVAEVRGRIDKALRSDRRWQVISCDEAPLSPADRPLAARLLATTPLSET